MAIARGRDHPSTDGPRDRVTVGLYVCTSDASFDSDSAAEPQAPASAARPGGPGLRVLGPPGGTVTALMTAQCTPGIAARPAAARLY